MLIYFKILIYRVELITLPFQGDNRLQDNNFGTLALTGKLTAFTNYYYLISF
jgi:hypothetical protein